MTNDYLVQVRIKNNRLLLIMKREGYDNVHRLAKAAGIGATRLGQIVNFKTGGKHKATDSWRPTVVRLADFLRCLPEDIIPEQHWHVGLKRNRAEITASKEDIGLLIDALAPKSLDEKLMDDDRARLVREAVATLTPRQQAVLTARFGLGADEPKTLEEVAQEQGVTRERIRQVEANAFRRLKHPAKHLDLALNA